jgi:dissimilatory sulfite reductase (desulfoviridin) alpha/beta subunit
MQWDNDAVEAFVRMPIADGLKETCKIYCEKIARRNKSDRVTMKEIKQMKPVYYGRVSEEMRNKELDRRIAEGETDLRERMEKAARTILQNEADLFTVSMCHAQYFRCVSQNIEVRELRQEIIQKLRALGITEMIADMLSDNERILAHHKLHVTISGCVNGCEAPEIRAFAIAGAAQPIVTSTECSECYICVDQCRRNAILLRNGRPEIDLHACDQCGNCIKFCPKGVFATEDSGYRIFAGGRFGRFHRDGYLLFGIADKETLFRTLEASIELIREEAVGEEALDSIIKRIGVAPLFQKLYQKGAARTRKVVLNISGMTCDKCSKHVGDALQAVPGVVSATIDLDKSLAHVVYEPSKVSLNNLKQTVVGAGYGIDLQGSPVGGASSGECCS